MKKKCSVCVCITCKNNQTEAFCVAVPDSYRITQKDALHVNTH